MKKPLTIVKIGNSLALTISDLAHEMGLSEGDRVYAVRTPRGFEIFPYEEKFKQAIDAARDFMGNYPDAMKKLAE
ncbi:MAG: hypothetical protein U1E15_03100 [Hyphomicrobiales bacterium]